MNPDTTDDLIGEGARALIGTEFPPVEGYVVKKEFQRWAAAVKDRNPLYFDSEYAHAHGYRDVIMPPLYLQHVTGGVADLDKLRPDGIPGGGGTDIPLPKTPRRMAGGENLSFYHPVYDGDRITSVRRIDNIEQKQGRSGEFVLITSTTTYTRGDGVVVAKSTWSTIARP